VSGEERPERARDVRPVRGSLPLPLPHTVANAICRRCLVPASVPAPVLRVAACKKRRTNYLQVKKICFCVYTSPCQRWYCRCWERNRVLAALRSLSVFSSRPACSRRILALYDMCARERGSEGARERERFPTNSRFGPSGAPDSPLLPFLLPFPPLLSFLSSPPLPPPPPMSRNFETHSPVPNECLLLEDLVQSCVRGKRGKVKDMC